MNPQTRKLGDHILDDNDNYHISFYLEREAAGTPVHFLMNLIKQKLVPLDRVQYFFERSRAALENYMVLRLAKINSDDEDIEPSRIVSFALALPRLFSTLVYHLLRYYPDIELLAVLNRKEIQDGLICDALHTIMRMHEIRANLWVRNGQVIRMNVNFYRSSRFAGQTFDLDLHGLQVAFSRRAAHGQARLLMKYVASNFVLS